ncbi:hypothetical protein [Streptomyces sannanensis]
MRRKAPVAAVLVLLLATACGAEGSGQDAGSDDRTGSGGTSALDRAALAAADLPGYQVSATKPGAASEGRPAADRAKCQPLADVMGDRPSPTAGETVTRGIGSTRYPGLAVSASLSAYTEADARKLIKDLDAAVGECGTGFGVKLAGKDGAYEDVKAQPYRVGGDESVSWTLTAAAKNVTAPVHMVVVREGTTVVRLMALDVTGGQQPRPRTEVPREVADKQLAKLAGAPVG